MIRQLCRIDYKVERRIVGQFRAKNGTGIVDDNRTVAERKIGSLRAEGVISRVGPNDACRQDGRHRLIQAVRQDVEPGLCRAKFQDDRAIKKTDQGDLNSNFFRRKSSVGNTAARLFVDDQHITCLKRFNRPLIQEQQLSAAAVSNQPQGRRSISRQSAGKLHKLRECRSRTGPGKSIDPRSTNLTEDCDVMLGCGRSLPGQDFGRGSARLSRDRSPSQCAGSHHDGGQEDANRFAHVRYLPLCEWPFNPSNRQIR